MALVGKQRDLIAQHLFGQFVLGPAGVLKSH